MNRFKGQSTRRQTDTSGHNSSAIVLIYSACWQDSDTIDDLWTHNLLRPPAAVSSFTQKEQGAALQHKTKQRRIRTNCNLIKADAGGDVHIPALHLPT